MREQTVKESLFVFFVDVGFHECTVQFYISFGFFASEVAHFLAILKSALGGSFQKTVKNSKSSLWFKRYHG